MKHYRTMRFSDFAKGVSHAVGRPVAFIIAAIVLLVWAASGPLFHFSDTWQLIINTGTTIVTFLMVFLIQNTQNRESQAIQLKLDELIRALSGAQNALLDLEDLDEKELEKIRADYLKLAERARQQLRKGRKTSTRGEVEEAAS
jgi:low affinity Fe/Cu permease